MVDGGEDPSIGLAAQHELHAGGHHVSNGDRHDQHNGAARDAASLWWNTGLMIVSSQFGHDSMGCKNIAR